MSFDVANTMNPCDVVLQMRHSFICRGAVVALCNLEGTTAVHLGQVLSQGFLCLKMFVAFLALVRSGIVRTTYMTVQLPLCVKYSSAYVTRSIDDRIANSVHTCQMHR